MPRILWVIAFLVLIIAAESSLASNTEFSVERKKFVQAEKALKAGNLPKFYRLAESLRDYPLYPYLRYKKLRRTISNTSNKAIHEFLTDYKEVPLAPRLRRAWLRVLAKKRHWNNFLDFYQESQSTELQCHRLSAQLATKNTTTETVGNARKLWLVGHSQEDACDPAFNYLYDNNLISADMRWSRISLAMGEQNTKLANYLARKSPRKDRDLLKLWQQVHRKPVQTLRHPDLQKDNAKVRTIVLHGVKRWSRSDIEKSHQGWYKIKNRYSFSKTEINTLENYMAMRAVYVRHPRAQEWLSNLPKQAQTDKSREWKVRTALGNSDWSSALRSIDALPRKIRKDPQWQYWKARSLENLDRQTSATELFRVLAPQRSYFSFLAADRLNWPYVMEEMPIPPKPQQLAAIESMPAIQRAKELFYLDKQVEARREWFYITGDFSEAQLLQAARLAHQWGWHDRAIITVGKTKHRNDLQLRFPLAYQKPVQRNAKHYGLDPAWIMGILRQESAFMKDVRSSAGAMGLMQLMPRTGKETARLLNIPLRNRYGLLDADKNIRIGSGYLSRMLDRFKGNTVMATAAYNAGPHRVDRWRPKKEPQDAELWAELIPFTETRKYVRRVLAYATVFEWRMERPTTQLRKRMKPVPPKRN